eukprot:CAMPEP_0197047392 /NCGR_PEP_ID=MMETSP1384-20130603/22904_1 /TAXON_ID=29189 /ORGANISM="Ammonia sp." /LENGTH=151 /DNA_ID=CAMNT_0042479307 /DNA_START=624 /DNA_END=1079 /DNA_ORIENTATION=-
MVRAKQTAELITYELFRQNTNTYKPRKQAQIEYDANLNEGAPSYIEPKRDDLDKSGFFDNVEQDSIRIRKAFDTYIHRNDGERDQQVLIIGHGNVFRYFLCRALQIPDEAWLRFSICNCSITKFKIYADGTVGVQCIGSDGHLRKEQVTFN